MELHFYLDYAYATLPIELSKWKFSPQRSPSWWPKANSVGVKEALEPNNELVAYLEGILKSEKQEIILAAEGAIEPKGGWSLSDPSDSFKLIAFAYKIDGREIPTAEEVANDTFYNNTVVISTIDEELMKENSLEQYAITLELFSKKYAGILDDIKNNPEDLSILIHTMIDEIVVLSRPVVPEDKVVGKKKANQQMHDGLHIKLRLPQDMVASLINLNKMSSDQEVVSGALNGPRMEHFAGYGYNLESCTRWPKE